MSLDADFGALHRVVVGGAGVVGHDISGLQLQLLEEERVTGRDFLGRDGRGVTRVHRTLGAAVHRVHRGQAAARRSRPRPAPRRRPPRCWSASGRGPASRRSRSVRGPRARRSCRSATLRPSRRWEPPARCGRFRPRRPRWSRQRPLVAARQRRLHRDRRAQSCRRLWACSTERADSPSCPRSAAMSPPRSTVCGGSPV